MKGAMICSLEVTINPCDPCDAWAYQTITSRCGTNSPVVEVEHAMYRVAVAAGGNVAVIH